MIKGMRFFTLLAALLMLVCGASAETMACEHQWEPYDMDLHGVRQDEIELHAVTDDAHAYMFTRPSQVCSICGERTRGSYGGASYASHSYTVTHWAWNAEKDAVMITWECGVCQHVYTDAVTRQTILDGTGKTCLQGGSCNPDPTVLKVGDLYENGMILQFASPSNLPYGFETGDKVRYEAVIYDREARTFQYALRTYCPVCGRPWNHAYPVFQPQTQFNPRYNGLPIMTEEYFRMDGMPENLPYQLIDQLREEAETIP